ncbi:MAG TPA: bifunctional tRNA (5-methylaminomethyl-2-thiouridine)(34)-methyltransferase MnmD/FAD-dependent 5-carboxymethylaminomethyl-2-thiouridine(34) oxidoreductase MnmC, partial [Leptospiraceae bacterium]|nr:bifunctional tRNA (5-methylaminomethyl-2-thiouridine)(34)-methyltransferase MnmD/FAD-dependent 5-carboxymethylaminomethyl-2-thiouridine(34) oxidoreductase MnmC [Leptospiraceae bacterium]
MYWSNQGGPNEKEHVFLHGNNIVDRLSLKKKFSIFEFGFGSGLNFFILRKQIRKMRITSRICYYSIEKYPLPVEIIQTILKKLDHSDFDQNDFISFYSKLSSGFNSIYFPAENLELVLIINDVIDILPTFHAKIDAWYLDGFSPSKNPEMWTKEIFSFIKRNSKQDATFSTYTTAKIVREGLSEVGFNIEKSVGFGQKKEMLKGQIPISQQKIKDKPWYRSSNFKSNSKNVIIIGGGLAGTALAFALSREGYHSTILEKGESIACGASGNPAGMFAPILTGDDSELMDWSLHAFFKFVKFLKEIVGDSSEFYKQVGVVQKLSGEVEYNLYKTIVERLTSLQDLTDLYNQDDEYFIRFKDAGWINPGKLCETYIELAREYCNVKLYAQVSKIESIESGWKVFLSSGDTLSSEIVVLANSFSIQELLPWFHFYNKVRGQIVFYPSANIAFNLKNVFLHKDGYMIPNIKDYNVIGSTFDPNNSSSDLSIEDNLHLLQKLKNHFSEIDIRMAEKINGRVGFRAMTTDHLPIIGPIPDLDYFSEVYSDLWKSNIYKDYPNGKYLSGLYLNCGHGSRGILNTFLAAHIITSMITGNPSNIKQELLNRIHPA